MRLTYRRLLLFLQGESGQNRRKKTIPASNSDGWGRRQQELYQSHTQNPRFLKKEKLPAVLVQARSQKGRSENP